MPVLTIDECKEILGIDNNLQDKKLLALILYVQEDIVDYCHNSFGDTSIYRQSGSALEFYRGSTGASSTLADRIIDAESLFSTIGFKPGMDIILIGGSNEGVYELEAVSAVRLLMTSTGSFVAQSQITYHNYPGEVLIQRIKWPKALKLIAAKMVQYLINKTKTEGIQSERIDDYSVTYVGSRAYPDQIIAGLGPYKRAVFI